MKKLFALILSVALVVTMAPVEAMAAQGTTSNGSIIVSNKTYEISPDVTEREYITNNADFSAQQMGHVLEVKLGENATIIAGYNDYAISTIKSGSNWGMRKTTEQAQAAETQRGVNVVAAVNADGYDMSNGRPGGALVLNSEVIQKGSRPCFYIDKEGVAHIEANSANIPDGVKEAVGGLQIIVKDGAAVEISDTTKHPRTAIGLKADGTVVIYMVDGRQAPLSVGMDYAELAATMIDLGCVTAMNLDGGGSSTFATQRAGDVVSSNDKQAGLTMRCSPSDGYERTVSSSLLVVSTSEADGVFYSASITPNNEVYTPGSTVQFEAAGADKSGAAVDLPSEGLSWSITSGASLGSIDSGTGVFTAASDATGTVAVALSYNGNEVGSTSIELQWPDKLGFTNSSVSLDFGESSDLSFTPTYQGREVHYKDGDFDWTLDEENLGTFSGNIFKASADNSTNGKATVKIQGIDNISGEIEIIVGMEPYVLMDFEDKLDSDGRVKEKAEDYWKIHVGNAAGNMLTKDMVEENRLWIRAVAGAVKDFNAELVTDDGTDNVRFGQHSVKMSFDFTTAASSQTSVAEFGFAGDTMIDIVKPNKIGMWINIPKEYAYQNYQLKAIIKGNAYTTTDSTAYRKYDKDYNESLHDGGLSGTTKYVNYYSYDAAGNVTGSSFADWAGKGWIWVECDISSMQMPIDMCRAYTVRIVAAQNVAKNAGYIYIDNLQFIYGTNTNDINNPVIDEVIETSSNTSMSDGSTAEFTTNKPTFEITINDSEQIDKYASKIDTSSIKLSVDGTDVTGKAEIGQSQTGVTTVRVQSAELLNSEHTLKVSVKDYYGNKTEKEYKFKTESEEAQNAAIKVSGSADTAVVGSTYSLVVENQAEQQADFVETAEVTISVGSTYGNAIKDELASHVTYGTLYEQSAEPTYADGKVTIYAKKKATQQVAQGDAEGQDVQTVSKTVATLTLNVPSTGRQGDTIDYSVTAGKYNLNNVSWTFSQSESKIPLSAEYTISAGDAVANYPLTFNVVDSNGEAVASDNITLYNASNNTVIDNPYTFTAGGRYTIYAKDTAGKRSWNYDVVVNALGTDGDGSPFGIQNNATENGSTQKAITWLAAVSGSQDKAYIKLADSEEGLDNAENQEGTSKIFTFTETNGGNAYRLNEVKLTGLTAETTYYYKVGDGQKWSDVKSFKTAGTKNTATNFFIFGDIQTSDTANLSAAIKKVMQNNESGKEYAFGIQTGDAIDNVTTFANWRAYLNALSAETLGSIDIIHALGNHEYYGDTYGKTAGSIFSMPASTGGSYYSAEYGNVYVGVINDGGDILEALESAKTDAAATDCVWKVLVMHEPVYGTESTMEDEQRLKVTKAIENAGFDAVFSGDDHTYTRTLPMKGDKALEAGSRDGVVYYICGDLSGKDNAYTSQEYFAEMIPHSEYQGMYMSVEATTEKMVLTAYKYNGELLDSYTIAKTACELGNHTFDETCKYDMTTGTIACKICGLSISAEDSAYTGVLSTSDDKYQVYLAAGKLKTGWITNGEEMLHAGDDGILHQCTTTDTATCLKNGQLKFECSCGETKTGAATWSKGHTWNDEYICTVCGKQGISMDEVSLELNGTSWEYRGTAIRPSVSGYYKYREINASSDRTGTEAYKTYANNTAVGMGTVTFEGRGDFYGSKSIDFPIVPKSVKSLTASKTFANAVKLEWDAAAGAQLYNIAMQASNGDWEIVQTTSECSALIGGLNPNTEYKFSITTETDVDGTAYEGKTRSETLTVTTSSESASKTENKISALSVTVSSGGQSVEIPYKKVSGTNYIYLPSCADLDAVKFNITLEDNAGTLKIIGSAGEVEYSDATINLASIATKNEAGTYELLLQIDGSEPMQLSVMKAEEISAIFLTSDDASKGRNYVDSTKGNSAAASMLMVNKSGSTIYDGALKQLKSRGNTTFVYYDKKSYQIKLETESDLLGTSENVKTWVLLAGYADATQMHDKLFKDLAAELGMEYTASCDWVDLYYDGEYRGIYLLSEKNSIGSSSVNITDLEAAYQEANPDTYGQNVTTATGTNKYGQTYQYVEGLTDPADITGGYLIERNLSEIDETCGFYTRQGGGFNVKSPEYASNNALKYISEYYQEFEDAVLAQDEEGNYTGINPTTGKHYYEYCDKDSLVKVFLLQELSANSDGFLSSFFFYKEAGDDNKLYAGPIWDQEVTLGMSWSYTVDPTATRQYYLAAALIKIPDFAEAAKTYYSGTFQAEIKNLTAEGGTIDSYEQKIASSAKMNYTMWPFVKVASPEASNHLWEEGTTFADVISNMREWITYRINNLDVLYAGTETHTEHSYKSAITKPATTSQDGIRTYTCTVCGYSYTEKIEKLGGGTISGGSGSSGGSGTGGGGVVIVTPGTDIKDTNKDAEKDANASAGASDGKTVLVKNEFGYYEEVKADTTLAAEAETITLEAEEAKKLLQAQEKKISRISKGVKNTDIQLKATVTKKGIKLTWDKEKGYKVDEFQVYRSVKKNSGYGKKPFFTTVNGSKTQYINTKGLKNNKKYYYKIRGVRHINGKTVYTAWSNKASKVAEK